jgi:hypothetical protein
MAMYQRRFASSLYAARRSLERRLTKIERNLAQLGRRPPEEARFDERRLEDLEELTDEEVARIEEEIEEASLTADREQLERERQDLIPLIARAKELEERDVSSKLDKRREAVLDLAARTSIDAASSTRRRSWKGWNGRRKHSPCSCAARTSARRSSASPDPP